MVIWWSFLLFTKNLEIFFYKMKQDGIYYFSGKELKRDALYGKFYFSKEWKRILAERERISKLKIEMVAQFVATERQ